MELDIFIKGLISGMVIGAPIGPIGMLCVSNIIKKGKLNGLFSGLGAAASDALYACIIGLGLTYVSQFLLEYQVWLRIFGGGFICYIGISILRSKASAYRSTDCKTGYVSSFVTTFFVSFTNPVTLFTFLALFAGLGIGAPEPDYLSTVELTLGVFIGSSLWWVLLTFRLDYFREKINPDSPWVKVLKKALGLAVLASGLLIVMGNMFHIL